MNPVKNIDVLDSAQFSEIATSRLEQALTSRDQDRPFHLFLSGGSTPQAIYAALAEKKIDWRGVHLWWGDERFVPHDHADSNYRMVKEALLDKIEIAPLQVHSWPILSTPELSADTYDREFRSYFVDKNQVLDLQLLGMGEDGHTASLFPGTKALMENERYCLANRVESKDCVRLTLTFPALALSRRVVFLVKGEGKAAVLREVVEENFHPAGQVAAGHQAIEFWIDPAAAAELTQK